MKLKIGDFARVGQVTVQTLRHYDELGLLKPAVVDVGSGYRYYTIQRDQPLIDAMILAESRLWDLVQSGLMPNLTGQADESEDESARVVVLLPGESGGEQQQQRSWWHRRHDAPEPVRVNGLSHVPDSL